MHEYSGNDELFFQNAARGSGKIQYRVYHCGMTTSDCIFCKIARNELSAERVYEDEKTLAFLDIRPNNLGHTLVIPKHHSTNMQDIAEEDAQALMRTVRTLTPAIKKAMGAEGVNIVMNNDAAAGQIIFHTHFHLIPRFSDDGYRHWEKKDYKDGEMEKTAEQIRAALS